MGREGEAGEVEEADEVAEKETYTLMPLVYGMACRHFSGADVARYPSMETSGPASRFAHGMFRERVC